MARRWGGWGDLRGGEEANVRARNIKPGFFKDEELAAIPVEDRFQARYLFAGLWCLADCEGRLEDKPSTIRGELFMHDEEVGRAQVHALLQVLHDRGFIIRYVAGGKNYIQVTNFVRHQNPHKEERKKGSEIPPFQLVEVLPSEYGITTESVPKSDGSKTEPLAMIPDSLIPDSLIPDSLIPDSLIPDSLIPENGYPVSRSLTVVPQVDERERDYWPMFWGLFVAAGLPLNDRDKERTLRLWLNHDAKTQERIISWVIEQFKSGTWSDAKHTMRPYNALESEGWTRIASPRVIPDPNSATDALMRHMEAQRARGLR